MRLIRTQDKAANHDVVTCVNEAAGAEVAKLRSGTLIQVISLDQANAGPAILAINDRGVEAGVEGCDDGRLQVVGGSQASRLDARHLRLSFQLSLLVMSDPSPACNSRTGSVSGSVMPKLASEGPIARKRTRFASPGVMMIPPMETLSPVPTSNLVETLSDCAGGVGVGVGVGVPQNGV